jgi:hypothetical protein
VRGAPCPSKVSIQDTNSPSPFARPVEGEHFKDHPGARSKLAEEGSLQPERVSGVAMRTEGRRTEARKVVRHFFTRLSTALVTLLPSFDSNFSGRLSNPKQCFQVSLSTS